MNAWLYLTTPNASPEVCRFTWWQAGEPSRSGTLQEAAHALAGLPLTLLLPIEMASYHQVEVPARSGRWLHQAIQSALEEQLLGELEAFHIARSAQQKGHCNVFAIRRDALQTVLSGLAACNLQPHRIFVDADCLPGTEPAAIWCQQRWLVGNLPATRLALTEQERQELHALLPADMPWHGGPQRPEGLTPDSPWHAAADDALLNSLHGEGAIDLRQDAFRYAAPRRLGWKAPAALLTVFLTALLAHTVAHRLLLERHTAALHAQNVAAFRQRFPDEQRIVNLREQVAVHQQQPSSGPQGLGRRLEQLAQHWQASGGSAAVVRNVQYRAGEGWAFQVSAPAFADLEHIREGLTQQHLAVQSNSTVRDASGVSSQFRVGE